MTTYEIIARAVREKKAISAIYNGRRRVMCPHVIGTKNGRPQALFYQFAGESSTRRIGPPGDYGNWRCMAVDALSDVGFRTASGTLPETTVRIRRALAISTWRSTTRPPPAPVLPGGVLAGTFLGAGAVEVHGVAGTIGLGELLTRGDICHVHANERISRGGHGDARNSRGSGSRL